MRAGDLRHLITIERSTPTAQSPSGEKLPEWHPYRTVHAGIEPQRGGEIDLSQAKAVAGTISYKITTRYVPGVLPSMRIRFGGSADAPHRVNPANLAGMTLAQLSERGNCETSERRPRYFAINAVINPSLRNIMLIMDCTEVVLP
jgi:SPP1 family predicted phage head-tail adaptor